MKPWIHFFIAVICLSATSAHGNEEYIRGHSLATFAGRDVRNGPINKNNFFDINEVAGELALSLEGLMSGINWRLRYEHQQDYNDPRSNSQLSVQELSKAFSLSDYFHVTVGKTQLNWDSALSYQVLGFFQRDTNFFDLTDNFALSEGLPLLSLSYLSDKWNLTLVYSNDFLNDPDGFNRGLSQNAANITFDIGRTTTSVIVQKPEGQRTGIGATTNIDLSDYLVAYGSIFTRKGTRRPFSSLIRDDLADIATDNPNGSHRIDSSTRYTRFVVGINAAMTTGYSVVVEFSFDKRGLDKAEWRRYLDLISAHREAATAADANIKYLGFANLAFDAEILLPQGARQKYIFTQITKTGRQYRGSFFCRYGLDESVLLGTNFDYALTDRLKTGLISNFFVGGETTEYGLLPARSEIRAYFQFYF